MMKRLIPILLLCAALLLTLPALAASTEEEWNASCNWVISQNTTLYSASFGEDATTATDLSVFKPFGTISAGAKVSIRSSANGMREIYYWNGGKRSAWVEDSAVRWAGSSSGSSSSGSSGSTTGTNLGSRKTVKSSGVWKALDVTLYLGEGETMPVSLEQLGTAECIVFDGEAMQTVLTENLYWETKAEDDQRLGIVYAPKTGKATLRASDSTKAKSLMQCKAGMIVVVLEVDDLFTRVMCEGKEGYILTNALTLCGAVPEEDFTHATLAYKGRTNTSSTVPVYSARTSGWKIKQWRVGNEVVKLNEVGKWSEIEIEGWHGWVKTEYLK